MSKTLTYDHKKNLLQHSDGTSISLARTEVGFAFNPDLDFWQTLPWSANEFDEIHLGDLPCRLNRENLLQAMKKISELGTENAKLKIQIPHPRHDHFLHDIGYRTALLPEIFTKLGVNFEMTEVFYELDPHWQNSLDQGKITEKDIELISLQANNVISSTILEVRIHKSNWKQTQNPELTPEMKEQLLEQMTMHQTKGNHEAANVIQKYLDGNRG